VLHVNENDTLSETKQLIIYTNLPITCQSEYKGKHYQCWMKFKIRPDTQDVAMRARYPLPEASTMSTKPSAQKSCSYKLETTDWKPDEGFAYNYAKPLQVIAKVYSMHMIYSEFMHKM